MIGVLVVGALALQFIRLMDIALLSVTSAPTTEIDTDLDYENDEQVFYTPNRASTAHQSGGAALASPTSTVVVPSAQPEGRVSIAANLRASVASSPSVELTSSGSPVASRGPADSIARQRTTSVRGGGPARLTTSIKPVALVSMESISRLTKQNQEFATLEDRLHNREQAVRHRQREILLTQQIKVLVTYLQVCCTFAACMESLG